MTSGLRGSQPVEDPLGGGDGDARVSARDADVVEGERRGGARIQHGQRIAHERDAGELGRGDPESSARESPHQLGGGHGLARVHAGTRHVDHGHQALEQVGGRHGPVADVSGTADPVPQLREGEDGAQHLRAERRTDLGIDRSAAAEDPAEIEHLEGITDCEMRGHHACVPAQRAPGAEDAREHVSGAEGEHAAGDVLHRVVGGLVLQDPDRQHVALRRDDPVAHDHFRRQTRRCGLRRLSGPGAREWLPPCSLPCSGAPSVERRPVRRATTAPPRPARKPGPRRRTRAGSPRRKSRWRCPSWSGGSGYPRPGSGRVRAGRGCPP